MFKVRKSWRQGDVCVVLTDLKIEDRKPTNDALPRDAKGSAILANGEVTGHSHKIVTETGVDPRLVGWQVAPEGWQELTTEKEVTTVHEEHGAIRFDPGVLVVLQQREESLHQGRMVID